MSVGILKIIQDLKAADRFEDINSHVPYSAFIGFECIRQDGEFLTVLRQKDTNIGNTTIPAVHGGVVGALLEHAAVMQLLWAGDALKIPRIINLSVDYLRPCLGLKDTYARGVVIKQGKRIANVRVEAWQDAPQKPVGAAHAHFLID